MKIRTSPCLIALGAFAIVACVSTRQPRAIAAQQGAQCDANVGEKEVLDAANVERVAPLYAHVNSGPNGYEARLAGAQITVRPDGTSPEALAHALRCYEALHVLRGDAPVVADPFVLPNDWVDIDAKTDGARLIVSVRSESYGGGQQVLQRATARYHVGGDVAQDPSSVVHGP